MLSKDNESMQEAVNSIYIANADEMVRQKCLAREEAERHERTMLRNIKILENKNAELEDENTELKDENTELKDQNIELQNRNAELEEEIRRLKSMKRDPE